MSEEEPNKVAKLASVIKLGVPMMLPGSGPAPWKKKQQEVSEPTPNEAQAPADEDVSAAPVPTPTSKFGPPALPAAFLQRIASDVPDQGETANDSSSVPEPESQHMTHFKRAVVPKRAAASRAPAVAFESFDHDRASTPTDAPQETQPEPEQPSTMDAVGLNFSHTIDPNESETTSTQPPSSPAAATPSGPRPPALPPTHAAANTTPAAPPTTPAAATTTPTAVPTPTAASAVPFAPAPPSMPPPEDLPSFASLRRRSSSRTAPTLAAADSASAHQPALPTPVAAVVPPPVAAAPVVAEVVAPAVVPPPIAPPPVTAPPAVAPPAAAAPVVTAPVVVAPPPRVQGAPATAELTDTPAPRATPSASVIANAFKNMPRAEEHVFTSAAPAETFSVRPPPPPTASTPAARPPPLPASTSVPPPAAPTTPASTTASASSQSVAGGDANLLRTLHLQVAAARAARGKTEDTAPVLTLPSFFPPEPMALPPSQRSNDQVFLCGPLGYSSDPAKKGWRCMWAVLLRDRLELYQRFGDSKPRNVVPLEAALITAADDIASPAHATISIVRLKAETIYLRAEKTIAAVNANVPVAKADLPMPDPVTTHRGWLHAMRFRSENLEYIARCRAARQEPDERVLRAYDAQSRVANAHHVNMVYCPDALLKHLVTVPPGYLAPAPTDLFPPAPLAVEGVVLDLSASMWSQEVATAMSRILADPESIPVVAVRVGALPMALPVAETMLTALCGNSLSGLVEVDLSGASWLAARDAPALAARFLTSPFLKKLTTFTIRASDLSQDFIVDMCAAINASTTTQGGYGCISSLRVLDLAQNLIGDAGVTALMGVLSQSLSLSNCLTTIVLSHNPIGDGAARALAQWLAAPRPTTGYTGLAVQHQHAPYRATAIQHALLRSTLIADAGCTALAAALAWSTTLRTLDMAGSNKLSHEGAAALSHLAQINESLDCLRFLHYHLSSQALNAMRLMFRFERADPSIFDAGLDTGKKHFTRAVLASEYPPQ